MKRSLAWIVVFVLGGIAGVVANRWFDEPASDKPAIAARPAVREILHYRNPMGGTDTSPVPRKDSMGMDYIPVYANEAGGSMAGSVRIDATVQHNLGVRTAQAARVPLAEPLATVGYVQFDESRLTHVHVRAEGWLRALPAHNEGHAVRRGDTLALLFSPALVAAQGEYLAARARGGAQVAAAAEARLQALDVPADVIARLKAGGAPVKQLPIRADRDGTVSQLAVREGMFVTPEMELMTIGELGQVWIVAELFERQLGLVRVGAPVEIAVRSVPGRNWRGTVDYVYPVLDPATRTARLRVAVANADGALRPNMVTDLRLELGDGQKVLAVPRDAVIRGGTGDRVVRRHADGSYGSTAVHVGREFGDSIEVLHGLEEGDAVVTAAQFLIDSESSIRAELERLDDGGKEVSHEHSAH